MRKILAADGSVAAIVDAQGRIMLGDDPRVVAIVRNDADVFDGEAGTHRLGFMDVDGRIFDDHHELAGRIDNDGRIFDFHDRFVGHGDLRVDGAILLLVAGRYHPEVLEGRVPPAEGQSAMIDEMLEMAERQSTAPAVERNYQPLTDEEVMGKPLYGSGPAPPTPKRAPPEKKGHKK